MGPGHEPFATTWQQESFASSAPSCFSCLHGAIKTCGRTWSKAKNICWLLLFLWPRLHQLSRRSQQHLQGGSLLLCLPPAQKEEILPWHRRARGQRSSCDLGG